MNWRLLETEQDDSAPDLFKHPWGHHAPNLRQRVLMALTQRSFLKRGKLREKMTKLIMSLGRPLDIEFRACRYRIEARNNLIEAGLLTRPGYNAQEIDFLAETARDGGIAVDIGSNVGLYSLPLARHAGPEGRVLAIDANPDMVRHLNFNANASGLKNVTVIHAAVGGHAGRVDLRIRQDDVAIVGVAESETGSTQMLPLMTILAEAGINRVDSLKIDIEGYEDVAMVPFLADASDALLPTRIVIERETKAADYPGCVAAFDRLGYTLVARTRNNSMYERTSAKQ